MLREAVHRHTIRHKNSILRQGWIHVTTKRPSAHEPQLQQTVKVFPAQERIRMADEAKTTRGTGGATAGITRAQPAVATSEETKVCAQN